MSSSEHGISSIFGYSSEETKYCLDTLSRFSDMTSGPNMALSSVEVLDIIRPLVPVLGAFAVNQKYVNGVTIGNREQLIKIEPDENIWMDTNLWLLRRDEDGQFDEVMRATLPSRTSYDELQAGDRLPGVFWNRPDLSAAVAPGYIPQGYCTYQPFEHPHYMQQKLEDSDPYWFDPDYLATANSHATGYSRVVSHIVESLVEVALPEGREGS